MSEIKRQVEDLKRWSKLLNDAGFTNGSKKAMYAAFTIEDLSKKLADLRGEETWQKTEKL